MGQLTLQLGHTDPTSVFLRRSTCFVLPFLNSPCTHGWRPRLIGVVTSRAGSTPLLFTHHVLYYMVTKTKNTKTRFD